MITMLRKKIKSRLFQVLVWFTIILFALPLSINEIIKLVSGGGSWVASVNGFKISQEALARKRQEQEAMLNRLREQYKQDADMYFSMFGLNRDMHSLAIDALIYDSILDQAAGKLGLPVSDDAIVSRVLRGVNPDQLREYLRQSRISFNDFQEIQRHEISRSMLQQLVSRGVYVPEFVLRNYYQTNFLGKQFSIATIPFAASLEKAKSQELTRQELEQFFADKNDRFKTYFVPETRSANVWTFDAQMYGIELEPARIERYYQEHLADFKQQPVQLQVRRILLATDDGLAKAQELREELVANPELFAQRAQERSLDAATAKKGGLMAPFAQNTYSREFEKAAFALTAKGDISPVISTTEGLEIIQLVEKKPAVYKPLSSVQGDIKTILANQDFSRVFSKDAQAAIDAQDAKALQAFAVAKKAKKEELKDVTLSADPRTKALFRLAQNGATSYTEGGMGIIIQLTSLNKGYTPSLAQIEQRVKNDMIQERAASIHTQAVAAALERAKGASLAQFKAAFPGTVEVTGMIKPSDEAAVKSLEQRGISPVDIFQLETPGSVISARGKKDSFIVRLDALEPVNEADFINKKAELAKSAQLEESEYTTNGFVASLYRNATIKQNS